MFMDFLTSPGFRKYFANTSWMIGEKIIRMGVNFVVGIFIARKLGPGGYGLLSYGLSMVALFGIISSLGLDEIIVRNLVRDTWKKDRILGTTFTLRLAGAILILILAPSISYLINSDKEAFYIVLIIAFGPIFQSFTVIDFFFHSRVQARYSSIALGTSFGISSLLKVALICSNAGVFLFAAAYLFEYVAMALAFVIMYEKEGHRIFQWGFLRSEASSLLHDAFPVIFSGFLMIVYSRIDQVMIKNMLGNEAVGYYSVAVTMTEAWHVIPSVLMASLFPAIIRAKTDRQEIFHDRMLHVYGLLFWMAVTVALPVSLASNWIIKLLFDGAYDQSGPVLAILIWNCIFIFLQVANGKWIITENSQKIWLWITPVGCAINITGNLYLISRYGIKGAALVTLMTQFFTSHLAFVFSRKTLPVYLTQWKALTMPFLIMRRLVR